MAEDKGEEFTTSFEYNEFTSVVLDTPTDTSMFEKCPEHNRDILYYCTDHDQPGCRSCISTEHSSCETAVIVATDINAIENDIDFDILVGKIEELQHKAKAVQKSADTSSVRAEKVRNEVLKDFASFKIKVINALEDLELSIRRDINSITIQNKENMKQVIDTSKKKEEMLQSLATELQLIMKDKRKQHHEVAFTMQKANAIIEDIEQTLNRYDETAILEHRFFENDTNDLLSYLKSSVMIRRIAPKEIECNLIKEIQVDVPSTERRDQSGMVMLHRNTLVYGTSSDHKNIISTVDPVYGSVLTETHFKTKISDIAKFGNDKLAVSHSAAKRIVILNCDGTQPPEKEVEIPLPNECYGIASLHENLVVTFRHPPSVAILDTSGGNIQTFCKDTNGDYMFSFPRNVTVSADEKSLYVSDYQNNTVTSLGLDGDVIAVYKDDKLVRPRALYADRNMLVYVCGQGSNNIHVLTSDLNKLKIIQIGPVPKLFGVIPLFDLGTHGPVSIYLDERTDMLYVGMAGRNNIRQYQLSYR